MLIFAIDLFYPIRCSESNILLNKMKIMTRMQCLYEQIYDFHKLQRRREEYYIQKTFE